MSFQYYLDLASQITSDASADYLQMTSSCSTVLSLPEGSNYLKMTGKADKTKVNEKTQLASGNDYVNPPKANGNTKVTEADDYLVASQITDNGSQTKNDDYIDQQTPSDESKVQENCDIQMNDDANHSTRQYCNDNIPLDNDFSSGYKSMF